MKCFLLIVGNSDLHNLRPFMVIRLCFQGRIHMYAESNGGLNNDGKVLHVRSGPLTGLL